MDISKYYPLVTDIFASDDPRGRQVFSLMEASPQGDFARARQDGSHGAQGDPRHPFGRVPSGTERGTALCGVSEGNRTPDLQDHNLAL